MGLEWNGDELKAFLEKTKKAMDSQKSYVNALVDRFCRICFNQFKNTQ
jgi:hypothetical protein